MFPGAHASIIRNEAGEPMGWDYPGEPDYDPADFLYGDEDDDMDDEPERMSPIDNTDYDPTHRHTSECTSTTCYERYVDTEHDGPDHPGVMTYEEWKRA